MDKYQEYYAKGLNFISERASSVTKTDRRNGKQIKVKDRDKGSNGDSFKNGVFTIYQNDNYHITKYLIACSHPLLKEMYVIQNGITIYGERYPGQAGNYLFLTLDFENRVDNIYVVLNTKLIDTIAIPVVYVESNKEERDKLMEKEHLEELDKIVNLNIKTGEDFANVIFAPINNAYDHAKVTLFYEGRLIGVFESTKNLFYITLSNLTKGKYEISFAEFDKYDSLIYQSLKNVGFTIYGRIDDNGRNIVFI